MTKLKIGDYVVMNNRYYDKHQGEVFTIKAGPEMIGRKECFWLDGYDGAYCADGLDLYKPPTNEEWLRSCPPQELIRFLMNVAYGGQIRSVQKSTFDEEAEKWSKWLREKHK